ncbi:MAG: hypothetical protein GXY39_02160 [Actinomycetales bacterium]|nr:hypothetical protein [Actinomycetales bacterium]
MRSGSGRTWQVGPTSSDGSPTTLEHARRIASELGFELVEDRPQWRASCEACGWSTAAPTYADAGEAARAHADECPEAATLVEAV